METLAYLVIAILLTMMLSTLGAIVLSGSSNKHRRTLSIILGVTGAGLGARLVLSVDSLGANITGGTMLLICVLAIARAARPRTS
jgi:hypothetical protein